MKKLALIPVAIMFILFSANQSLACQCGLIQPSTSFDMVKAVFSGKVIESGKGEWSVAVDRVWKGEVKEVITLRDAHAGSNCALSFKKGVRHLFLADVRHSEGVVVFIPQTCNWNMPFKTVRFNVSGKIYWVEDLVLKNRGRGKPPIKVTSKEK